MDDINYKETEIRIDRTTPSDTEAESSDDEQNYLLSCRETRKFPPLVIECINPAIADHDDPNSRSTSKDRYPAFLSNVSNMVLFSVVVGLFLVCLSISSLHNVDNEISELLTSRKNQLNNFEKDIRALHKEFVNIEGEHEKKKNTNKIITKSRSDMNSAKDDNISTKRNKKRSPLEEVDALQKKVKVLHSNAESLKAQVQAVSREEVRQKYGPGEHKVLIILEFPNENNTEVHAVDYEKSSFIIELAPMNLMPHSVDFFLDMVSAGLLDGCSFILNTMHVLKVAPLPYDGSTTAAEKARTFTKHGLESVAFKEYTDEYPHKRYTVGFAADGSPSFYINLEDNELVHEGDPCFGTIISGFDAVKRLEDSAITYGVWLEKRIGIKSATIL